MRGQFWIKDDKKKMNEKEKKIKKFIKIKPPGTEFVAFCLSLMVIEK